MRQLEIELKLSVLPEAIKRIREKIICFRYTISPYINCQISIFKQWIINYVAGIWG